MAGSTPLEPADETAPRPDDRATAAALPTRRRFLPAAISRFFWPALCLFQLGLFLGLFRMWTSSPSAPEGRTGSGEAASPAAANSPADAPQAAPAEAIDLGRADDLLRQGRYELALAVYQPLCGDPATPASDALQYRLALCLEGLGRYQQAVAAYRALASRSSNPGTLAAGQLALARVYIRLNQPLEAKSLLGDLILRTAHPTLRNLPLLADARYLLAFALTAEAWHPDPPGPLNDSLVAHRAVDCQAERVLEWIVPAPAAGQSGPRVAEESLAVQKQGPTLAEILVSASLRQAAVSELLERLAEQSGLHCEWTAQARQQVAGRTTSVNVENLPLPDVLRALADALGLVWEMRDATLALSSEQEVSTPALAAHRAAIARRALRDAVLAHPGHMLTPAAYLELGNLEAADNHWKEAVGWYERLLKEAPRAPVTIEACYNLGLVERRLNDFAAARNALYRVVDRAPGHELTPLAYLKIGRMFLDEGSPDQAISPLRRSLSSAPGSSSQPAAAVTLAAAYLLTDNPLAANAVLVEQREQVNAEPYHALAAFLDSLARYRAAERRRSSRDAGDLLASLLALHDDPLLGPSGKLLAGRAYAELGLGEQAAGAYEKALAATRGALAAEVSYTLAESLQAADKRQAAMKLFSSLVAAGAEPWAARSRFRLAEVALQERRPQDCLTWCRELLEEGRADDASALLKLMGQAFVQVGDNHRASRCFAGQVPEP